MSNQTYPRIAILGAGPAGLTLGSLLSKSSISYTIFDLRSSPKSDDPSNPSPYSPLMPAGSLDLHVESGLLALKACDLYERFLSLKSECSEDTIIADKRGVVRWEDNGMGTERPEIGRNVLTDLLLSSVPDANIKWEHKVRSVTPNDSKHNYTIHFTTASGEHNEDFDIVFGADGAWSRLRSLLTDTQPHFSTINCITLTIPHITTKYPHLSTMIGQGSYLAAGDHNGVMAQRGSLDSARIYLMIQSASENWLQEQGIAGLELDPEAFKRKLLHSDGHFATWGEQIKELIAAGCDAAISHPTFAPISAKPLYMLPIGHTWSHRRNLTLIGDAAHLATPFAGEGVNAAMLDALELANQLVPALQSSGDTDDAIKAFEAMMLPRAEVVEQETYQNLEIIFNDNHAPMAFVGFMKSMGGEHGN